MDTSAPKVGDFSQPLVEPARAPAAITAAPASPTKDRLDAAEQRIYAEAAETEATLKPLEAYEAQLKEVGLTRDDAARIVDAVLVQGFYSEDFPITTRVRGTFRTRLARDTRRAHERLEIDRPTFDVHYQEALSRYLLAASIMRFGASVFVFPGPKSTQDEIEKAYQDRLAFVDNLSEPALRILYTKLAKFDRKVVAALQEGAIENF